MKLNSFPKKRFTLFATIGILLVVLLFVVELPVIVSSTDNEMCRPEQFMVYGNHAVAEKDGSFLPANISMLVWNVHKEKDNGWKSDLRGFSAESDLLLLQEGYATEALDDFFKAENIHWSMATAFTYRDVGAGVVTGSRVQPYLACALFEKEPLLKLPKGIQVTKYSLASSDKSLVVANVHLVNFALGVTEYQQQLKELHSILQEHDGPLIVAGDFNSWKKEREAVIAGLVDNLELQQLTFENDVRTSFMGYKLDHVLVRGVNINSATTVEVKSSDHNPILVNFSVK